MCNTAAEGCVTEEENPATIIADIAFVAVIGRQAPRRRCTGQDVRAGDSLAYRQARMLGLDGVDSGNATSPTAVPPHDFRINLHHSSQRRGSRAHTLPDQRWGCSTPRRWSQKRTMSETC